VKGSLLVALSLLAATSLSSVSADSIAFRKKVLATKDLLGYWPYESSLIDLSPSANDAKVVGDAAKVTFGPGANGGQALQLDNTASTATGNFVTVPAPIGSIFDVPKFTALVWAKVRTPRPPVDSDQWNAPFCRTSLWYISLNSADRTGTTLSQFVVSIYNPANPNGDGTGQVRDDDAGPFLKKDEWHQYALSYDGAKVLGYLDGSQVLTQDYDGGVGPTPDTPTTPPKGNYDLNWGAWDQRGDWFDGSLDDSAYFARALSADEIKGLYDAMLAKAP
jgi:hypothetical protein